MSIHDFAVGFDPDGGDILRKPPRAPRESTPASAEAPPTEDPAPAAKPGQAAPSRGPTPFAWVDPRDIEPRPWLYGYHLIRGYVSLTVAPGGTGKSTLAVVDALAMAAGVDLVGDRPHGPSRVWLWSGEDPVDEAQRRIAAAALLNNLSPDSFSGRLFVDSGRDTPIRLAEPKNGAPALNLAALDWLESRIKSFGIDVLIIDPLVQLHGLDENSNAGMDMLVKALAAIAGRTGCAIELVHHARKLNGNDADADSARGGSAIIAAVRSARVLNIMSGDTSKAFGIHEADRRSYIRVDSAKANLAPPGKARWLRLKGEPLGNHREDRPEDWVAVAEPWTPPAAQQLGDDALLAAQRAVHQKDYRLNEQSPNWAGHHIGRVLGVDTYDKPGKTMIKAAINKWLAAGALVTALAYDGKAKREVDVIEVGEWANPVTSHDDE